ncbi:MAG: calcium-binding protein, partial [Sulfurimicrobium sp.]|nr:calcium-binding protein [Sulfurimicrobium sp.]
YDTYLIEGNDTIQDSDGKGRLMDQAGHLLSGVIEKRADGTYAYLSDPSISVAKDANLTLTLADGTVVTLNNYQAGDLGFQLVDMSAQATTTLTITGDILPTDIDPGTEGIQAAGDAQGHPLGTAQPYEDILVGSEGNDRIQSGELDDNVGGRGGDDWIESGNGRDYVNGEEGNDLIEGGAGADVLAGDAGNDRIYGNAKIEITAAIANGNSDSGTGQKGDWLAGNDGEDTLVAGADNDVLAGGAGKDLLIAGAGDDYILGDADYTPPHIWENTKRYSIGNTNWFHTSAVPFNWTVTDVDGTPVFAPVEGELEPAGGGADVIYAGAGNDSVWAGEGDDTVMGEG